MGFSLSDLNIIGAINHFAGLVSDAFSTPAPLPPPPAPPEIPRPPTVDEAARRQEQSKLKRRRGRAATILTGPQGVATPLTATKALLGE